MYIGTWKITYDKYPVWFNVGIAINWRYKCFVFNFGYYALTIWNRNNK